MSNPIRERMLRDQAIEVAPPQIDPAPARDPSAVHPRYQRALLDVDQMFQSVNPVTLAVSELPIDEIRAKAKARIRAWRWAKSIGGTTLPNGMPLATDETTRSVIHQAITLIDLGLKSEPFNYSVPGGYVELTRADLIGMAAVSSAFVQACFDAGKALEEQIDAVGSINEIRAILAKAASEAVQMIEVNLS